jgi:hypothetical protein
MLGSTTARETCLANSRCEHKCPRNRRRGAATARNGWRPGERHSWGPVLLRRYDLTSCRSGRRADTAAISLAQLPPRGPRRRDKLTCSMDASPYARAALRAAPPALILAALRARGPAWCEPAAQQSFANHLAARALLRVPTYMEKLLMLYIDAIHAADQVSHAQGGIDRPLIPLAPPGIERGASAERRALTARVARLPSFVRHAGGGRGRV